MRNSYNTRQKEEILNLIKNYNTTFTAKDIYNALNEKVGLTTIYRLLDKLEEKGKLSKGIKENTTTYQYFETCEKENHFYLKCDNCNKLIHIDCDCIESLTNHIFNKHKFKPSKKHIIINGICKECEGCVKDE